MSTKGMQRWLASFFKRGAQRPTLLPEMVGDAPTTRDVGVPTPSETVRRKAARKRQRLARKRTQRSRRQ